jgi:hypothetical protein
VAHVLVERGLFGYDTPIVELWPEFGAHSKEGVPAETTPQDPCDWDEMCAVIGKTDVDCQPEQKGSSWPKTSPHIQTLPAKSP